MPLSEPLANPTHPEGGPVMRRFVPLTLAALLTIGFTSPVAAAKPDGFHQEPQIQDFTACGFPIHLEDSFAAGKILIFPTDDDGNTKLLSTGGFMSTLTAGAMTIDVKFFGHIELLFQADGTILIRQAGQALMWFDDAADAAMYGLEPGVYIVTGRVEVLTDENVVAIAPAEMNARVRNLCEELAPA
jgi:hypothetical protein